MGAQCAGLGWAGSLEPESKWARWAEFTHLVKHQMTFCSDFSEQVINIIYIIGATYSSLPNISLVRYSTTQLTIVNALFSG